MPDIDAATLQAVEAMTTDQILQVWDDRSKSREMMEQRANYYAGEHKILKKGGVRQDGKPYNKIVKNWVETLVDRWIGFLGTSPYEISVGEDAPPDDQRAAEQYGEVSDNNDLPALDSRLLKAALLYGYGVEVHSFDKNGGGITISDHDPREWAFIQDEFGMAVAAIRRLVLPAGTVYKGKVLKDQLPLWWRYTPKTITQYIEDEDGFRALDNPRPHQYDALPVFRWAISDDRSAYVTDAFISQQDAYNLAISEHLDDTETDIDAILKVVGTDIRMLFEKVDNEGRPHPNGRSLIDQMREERIFGTPDDNSDISFVTRGLPYDKTEFTLRTLRRLIHSTGKAPDIDEIVGATGATSGIALRLQFQQMFETAGESAKYIKDSLRKRVRLLNRVWAVKNLARLEDYDITVSFSIPSNEIELWQAIGALEPLLSRLDRLRLIPSVEDAQKALDAKKAEEEESRLTAGPVAIPPNIGASQKTAEEAQQLASQSKSPDDLIAKAQDGLEDELAAILGETGAVLPPAAMRQIVEELLKLLKGLAKT